MITANDAQEIAETAFASDSAKAEFADWNPGNWGSPILVHDIQKKPAYWLVPFFAENRVLGFARILGNGQIQAVGSFGRPGRPLEQYPKQVSGLSPIEAQHQFESMIRLKPGETATPPLFVHDGPPGREVWLIETVYDGRPHRWIFISAGGYYERPAGTQMRVS